MNLRLYFAAILAGFALIGLTFAVTIMPAELATVLLIIGTIIVIIFALVIVIMALTALFGNRAKSY
ncbi:hypothetical protein [Oceanobacillus sp. FSL H7-0719]|uniref:hypothetical protein n=1 Tax=Oceanobacillus sp. FSL H7-0719 TaxID=2954507 RepID=UPI003246CCB6